MSIANTVTIAINVIGLVFVGVQVMQARKALKEASDGQKREWDRQRKKSTIDAIVATAQYRESLKAVLPLNDRDPREVADFIHNANGDSVKIGSLERVP